MQTKTLFWSLAPLACLVLWCAALTGCALPVATADSAAPQIAEADVCYADFPLSLNECELPSHTANCRYVTLSDRSEWEFLPGGEALHYRTFAGMAHAPQSVLCDVAVDGSHATYIPIPTADGSRAAGGE